MADVFLNRDVSDINILLDKLDALDTQEDIDTALSLKINVADIDSVFSTTSENPVQNKVIYDAILQLSERVTALEEAQNNNG